MLILPGRGEERMAGDSKDERDSGVGEISAPTNFQIDHTEAPTFPVERSTEGPPKLSVVALKV
jgi:hypothetical protein